MASETKNKEDLEKEEASIKEGKDNAMKVINALTDSLSQGKFKFEDIALVIGDIAGVGAYIKILLKFVPAERKKNVVEAKLDQLKKSIEILTEKMSHHFDDMKAFMVEANFFIKIVEPIETLTKYMSNCLLDPTTENHDNFIREYEKNTPLTLTYTLVSYMGKDKPTNPLQMAMKADRLRTEETFNKWESIIRGALAQLLLLGAFSQNLVKKEVKPKKLLNINYEDDVPDEIDESEASGKIMKEATQLFEEFRKWKDDFHTNSAYWPGLEEYVKEFQGSTKLKLPEIADELKKALETIYTRDAFFLTVSSNETDRVRFSYTKPEYKDQFMSSINVGACSVEIYRSRNDWGLHSVDSWSISDNPFNPYPAFERMAAKWVMGHPENDFSNYPKNFVENNFTDAGGCCMTSYAATPEFRVVNTPREQGPGIRMQLTRDQTWYYKMDVFIGVP